MKTRASSLAIVEILNQPSPINLEYSKRIKQLLLACVSVFIFFVVFRPFGLNDETFINCVIISAYYSFIVLCVGAFNVVLIPFALPDLFKEASWTLKKNIIWGFWNLFSYATCIFLAGNVYYHFYNLTLQAYVLSFYYVLILGFPLSIISSILHQYYLLKKHQKIAEILNKNLSVEGRSFPEDRLEFVINKFKKVRISVHSILYVEAVENYIDVVYENNGIKKIIIRETIGSMEQKTSVSGNIFRIHRSYLVNINYIKNITGDSQGLKIHLKEIDNIIPVSRSKIKKFRALTSESM